MQKIHGLPGRLLTKNVVQTRMGYKAGVVSRASMVDKQLRQSVRNIPAKKGYPWQGTRWGGGGINLENRPANE